MTKLAFVDTETTGLDPDLHEIWEVALVVLDEDGTEEEYAWQLPVDLAKADPLVLRIGRFYKRRSKLPGLGTVGAKHQIKWPSHAEWEAIGLPVKDTAETVARLLDGAHIVGAVPSFDAAFLTRWLRAHGQAPCWHYHLVDVEALAAGWLMADARRIEADVARRRNDPQLAAWEKAEGVVSGSSRRAVAAPPWKSGDLSRAVGVDPDDFDRHTALGGARWARAIYDIVMGDPA